jgi:hypothetical protein
MDLSWAATYNFRLNGGLAWYDAELTKEYCGFNDINGIPVTSCPPGTINPNDPWIRRTTKPSTDRRRRSAGNCR